MAGRLGRRLHAVNQYGGPYAAGDDGSFSVGGLSSTMMAKPESEMKAEKTYLDLLQRARRFRIEGDTLTLSVARGGDSLVFTRSQASPGP